MIFLLFARHFTTIRVTSPLMSVFTSVAGESFFKSFAAVELVVLSTFIFVGIASIYRTYSKEDPRRPPGPPKQLDLGFGRWFASVVLLKQRINRTQAENSKENDKPTWMKFTELNRLYGERDVMGS